MIAFVRGEIVDTTHASVLLDVNNVGYSVHVPSTVLDTVAIGDTVTLHTYFHVREQSQDLFGFTDTHAKQLFETLLSVNGVGPKAGLAVLSLGEVGVIATAIQNGDTKFISAANGVGKRVAERVTVDLHDKLDAFLVLAGANSGAAGVSGSASGAGQDASSVLAANRAADDEVEALVALGYPKSQAAQAIAAAIAALPDDATSEDRIKQALKEIASL